jgi:uncharacterized protein
MPEDTMNCEFPDSNPPSAEIKEILDTMKTIAVVGLSDNPDRESNQVAAYLKDNGYRIVPVNPAVSEVLGEKSYPDLTSIPFPVDIVDIFRKVDFIPGIVDEAIRVGAKAVWMQLGLAHNASAAKARSSGMKVVQSKCIKVEHARMIRT